MMFQPEKHCEACGLREKAEGTCGTLIEVRLKDGSSVDAHYACVVLLAFRGYALAPAVAEKAGGR